MSWIEVIKCIVHTKVRYDLCIKGNGMYICMIRTLHLHGSCSMVWSLYNTSFSRLLDFTILLLASQAVEIAEARIHTIVEPWNLFLPSLSDKLAVMTRIILESIVPDAWHGRGHVLTTAMGSSRVSLLHTWWHISLAKCRQCVPQDVTTIRQSRTCSLCCYHFCCA